MFKAAQPMCVPSQSRMWSWWVPWTYSTSDVHLSCSSCELLVSHLPFTQQHAM